MIHYVVQNLKNQRQNKSAEKGHTRYGTIVAVEGINLNKGFPQLQFETET